MMERQFGSVRSVSTISCWWSFVNAGVDFYSRALGVEGVTFGQEWTVLRFGAER